jgi:hypothetical protein
VCKCKDELLPSVGEMIDKVHAGMWGGLTFTANIERIQCPENGADQDSRESSGLCDAQEGWGRGGDAAMVEGLASCIERQADQRVCL